MVQINGKYELVKSEKFAEYLIAVGIPEDKANLVNAAKPVMEVQLNGDNLKVVSHTSADKHVYEFVLNKEVDEQMLFNVVLKSTAVLDGDTITVNSKTLDGAHGGQRVHKFTDSGVVVTYHDKRPEVPVATRTYKRL